ncbi:uncharacterized protein LOC111710190 isoform X2 [Eurytemora carolleeae]|uniref:uncharacterized protein LOC111710190 isoform X2 n=1 Tax=Eurytemora carolleeae TaxID=1294199 RepID=UPI000C771F8C|nr:uncharacterized protein LOC111710190 isoform X2 [Eurytemora carolleeae]|eukprot:XP_023340017.1 uncharacterized protein LOC111710190 isoform X2 [Eurytemora affinis]
MVVSSIKLNTGRSIPRVGFGTGTSFINRGDDVTLVVQQAYQAGFRLFDGATLYGTEEGLGRLRQTVSPLNPPSTHQTKHFQGFLVI